MEMPMMPVADDIATGIVAACRETGEDPITCVEGSVMIRGRHFALHALIYVFPKCPTVKVSGWVGAPGKPGHFYENSLLAITGRKGRPRAHWWDEDVLDRVITAIEASRTRRAIAPKVQVSTPQVDDEKVQVACRFKAGDAVSHPHYGSGRVVEVGVYNKRRHDYPVQIDFRGSEQVLYAKGIQSVVPRGSDAIAAAPRAPIKLSANVGGYVSSEAPAPASDKRALQAMLADAARNTAKLQPKG